MIHAISQIFTGLLLPPGLFITLLVILSFFVKKGRWLLIASAALLYALSVQPVADSLLKRYETPFRHTTLPPDADAVVSLGGGNMRGNPIPLVDEAFKRHIYALALAKRMGIPLIVTGRGEEGYDEFQGLLDSLRALSPLCPADLNISHRYQRRLSIIPETESADTYENAMNARRILGTKDPKVIVVTSAYHMRRALMLFHLAGIRHAYPAAVNFYVNDALTHYPKSAWLPSLNALQNSYRALHEFFGIVKVQLRSMTKKRH